MRPTPAQVPDRLRKLADALEAGHDSAEYLAGEMREAADALEPEHGAPDPPTVVDGRVHVMRYLDSARTQLEQADDLELDEEQPLDGPHAIARALRYAVDRGTLQGRAVDDLIDAVHALNGSTNAEARELVDRQRAREAQAGLFDRTDGAPS